MAPRLLPPLLGDMNPPSEESPRRGMRCGSAIRFLSQVSDYILTGVWHKTLSEPGFNLGIPPSIRASLGGKQ